MLFKRKRKGQKAKQDHIDLLYESIKVKDMTRKAFRKAYLRVMNSRRSERDLNQIMLRRDIARQMRGAIDNVLYRS